MGRKIEDAEDSYEIAYLLDQTNITRQEAESAAADAFPGRVVENKLDDENGFAVWEIETFDENGGILHEAKVNAQNGDILAYETKGRS
ncbi:MAG: PepSY domain-containing protein [Rubrobacter sp.]|nr:PepSY domain-containing protein [Rubrobacter sp.]